MTFALNITFPDGRKYLSGEESFSLNSNLEKEMALVLTMMRARHYLMKGCKVNLCTTTCEYSYQVDRKYVDTEKSVCIEDCENIINKFKAYNVKRILCLAEGPTLEILPDGGSSEFMKKRNKLRRTGKCIDWTKMNSDLEWNNIGGWYLHGELEDAIGFDIGIVINATKAGTTKDAVCWRSIYGNDCREYEDIPLKRMHLDGVRNCKVIGVNDECIGFFYTGDERNINYDKGTFPIWHQYGYVVMKSDLVGLIQAYYRFIRKELY